MEIGKKFKNIDSYNESMSKHMKDKTFWYSMLPENKLYTFVDFGCADGAMINYLYQIDDINWFIGFDISETMIDLAKTKFNGDNRSDVWFTSNWDEVAQKLEDSKKCNHQTILILSSVIHEVYSYAKDDSEIDAFWKKVLESDFDYIVVRDMMVSKDTLRTADFKDFDKVNTKGFYQNQLNDFEKKYGKINIVKNLIHFLLKYRWKINWEREVNENYFPIMVEDFLEKMESYNLDYFKRFRVKFLDDEIEKDFEIKLQDFTHIKAIFSKKKNMA
jgi:SAM-dependent methyltransferase